MTIEEHVRAAEHHLTEAYRLSRDSRKQILMLTRPATWKRISTMLLNMRGLLLSLASLGKGIK